MKFLLPMFRSAVVTCLLAGILFSPVSADEETIPVEDQTSTGPLVLPPDENPEVEKKCLTVCEKWGENCFINPRTGDRKCRRTCKQLGKECI